MANYVIYRLTCEHLVPAPPNTLEIACVFCGWEKRRPIGIVIKEWHAYCVNTNCRWGRWTGLSEPLARQLKERHMQSKRGHTAVHRAEIRKDSLRIRDRMASNGAFTEAEAEESTQKDGTA